MRDPRALISTDALETLLGDADLRCFDCTTYLERAEPGSNTPYKVVSGRETFLTAHVPGADFLDLPGELSAPDTLLMFMMPSTEHLARAFGRHGLDDGVRVVLYSIGSMMWATRVWWMLRALGFDGAAVLDGGLDRWQAEGRPVATGEPTGYPPTAFTPRARPGYFLDRLEVKAVIGRRDTVTVNTLAPQSYHGLGPSPYRRPGRVPGSVNVPATSLIDPVTKRFISPMEALGLFREAGVAPDQRVIAYCGAGISATIGLFMLHQLGFDNLSLYDGSMSEWAEDLSLPIETD